MGVFGSLKSSLTEDEMMSASILQAYRRWNHPATNAELREEPARMFTQPERIEDALYRNLAWKLSGLSPDAPSVPKGWRDAVTPAWPFAHAPHE